MSFSKAMFEAMGLPSYDELVGLIDDRTSPEDLRLGRFTFGPLELRRPIDGQADLVLSFGDTVDALTYEVVRHIRLQVLSCGLAQYALNGRPTWNEIIYNPDRAAGAVYRSQVATYDLGFKEARYGIIKERNYLYSHPG